MMVMMVMVMVAHDTIQGVIRGSMVPGAPGVCNNWDKYCINRYQQTFIEMEMEIQIRY
jgi:hypothetical protein